MLLLTFAAVPAVIFCSMVRLDVFLQSFSQPGGPFATSTSEPPGNISLTVSVTWSHTPSTAFRHLPPNSARFSYATEGALFISGQKSTDAVSALRKVRVLTVEAT